MIETGSLTSAFATYRARFDPALNSQLHLTVSRLECDDRMINAWPSILRRIETAEQFDDILDAIVVSKRKADLFGESAGWPGAWDQEFTKLNDAILTLADFFRCIEFSNTNPNFEQFKTGLAWAKQTIERQHEAKAKSLRADMPNSRKRNQPLPAFYKLLCGEMNRRFGQPLCGFVAVSAAVCFAVTTKIDQKTVAAAWREATRNIS